MISGIAKAPSVMVAILAILIPWPHIASAQEPVPASTVPVSTSWSRIATSDEATKDGQVIGGISHERWEDDNGTHERDTQIIRYLDHQGKRLNKVDVTEKVLDEKGRPKHIRITSDIGKRKQSRIIYLWADHAVVERNGGANGERQRRVDLPLMLRYDSGFSLIPTWAWSETPIITFMQFSPAMENLTERVELERTSLSPDGGYTIVRRNYGAQGLRNVSILRFDARHHLLATEQNLAGLPVIMSAGTAADLEPPAKLLRPVSQMMIKSPYKMSAGALAGKIRYRFGFKGGAIFMPPETGEQKIIRSGDDIVMDICSNCGPVMLASEEELHAARQPTDWLQSDDPLIKRMADPVANMKIDDARKMQLLAQAARRQMTTIDFMGHFSAAEALRARRGDCTEDALVLAALGRAAGISTKVASGLVYTREAYHGVSNAFLPHSWTLAWIDGRWQSFDMSLDGFDASHIALTISDGEAESLAAANRLAGLLIWHMMAEVKRSGPATAQP